MAEKELIITRAAIAGRVKELGASITEDYRRRRLVVVGVLNGAFIFMADLVREIKLAAELDFVRVARYGMATSGGALRFTKGLELDIRGKDVLVVEDIVDTGRTMAGLRRYFEERGAASVRFCVLIDKKERRKVDSAADYVGFEVESGFLVGYGLDCREQGRHCPDVYRLHNL